MPDTSDPAPSASIFDHYAGFEGSTSRHHLRNDSDASGQGSSSGPSSSNHHHANHRTIPQSVLPLPSPALSFDSSSSSLRQTVDMLKGGVFPPGLEHKRSRRDSNSDGSHYDDDEDENYEQGFNTLVRNHLDQMMDPLAVPIDRANRYSNALDSPLVPERRSSAHSKASSKTSPLKKADVLATVDDGTMDGGKDSLIDKPISTSHASISPTHGTPEAKPMERNVSDPIIASTSTDSDLERRLALAADQEDPNRPRTLKEARALAKERAKMRLQAKDPSASPSEQSPSQSPNVHLPEKSTSSEYSPRSMEGRVIREKSAMRSAESSEWRGHSRQRATPITPTKEENDKIAETNVKPASVVPPLSPTAIAQMQDLQIAVGEAINDVSFSSSTITSSTTSLVDSSDNQSTTLELEIPQDKSMRNPASITSAQSATSYDYDSAAESMTLSRPDSASMYLPANETVAASQIKEKEEKDGISSPEQATTPMMSTSPSSTLNNSTTAPITLTSLDAISAKFIPHSLQAQQRLTAPNKIARLDVYGKTVPWPAAFNPAAIIEQRRLAPWERARSYAHYCNDLTSTPSGLQLWMEMVQRPMQRALAEPNITPTKRHWRGEGTDHSGYAASVRSDATFPMRGDGGRAKDLLSTMPATIEEPSPNILPTNIPYPSLVQQQATHRSSSSFDEAGTSSSASERDRSTGLSRPSFFTTLGRKGSSRRTPGTSSFTGFSPLSTSNSGGVGGTIRPRGTKQKTISGPVALNSSPSLASMKTVMDPMASEPTSYVASPQGTLPRSQMPPSPSQPLQLRMPMGPRALTNNALPSNTRRGSVASTYTSERDRSPSATSGEAKHSPTIIQSKSSLSYNSVRENKGDARPSYATLQTSHLPPPRRGSVDTGSTKSKPSSRRGSHHTPATAAEEDALDKLSDVLPDAERSTLLEYLRRAGGNDLVAIGDYLQAQSQIRGKALLR